MDLYYLFKYKVITTPVEHLSTIYKLNDGLAYRLKEQMTRQTDADYQTFMTSFKSKRYTWSRLQRTLLYTLLNIRQHEMQQALDQPYLRLLGASKTGRTFIKQQRKHVSLPVVNPVTHAAATDILTV